MTVEEVPGDVPVPVLRGTFAVYAMPDGGYRLVTETPERGVDVKTIPGRFVKMAGKMLPQMFAEKG